MMRVEPHSDNGPGLSGAASATLVIYTMCESP